MPRFSSSLPGDDHGVRISINGVDLSDHITDITYSMDAEIGYGDLMGRIVPGMHYATLTLNCEFNPALLERAVPQATADREAREREAVREQERQAQRAARPRRTERSTANPNTHEFRQDPDEEAQLCGHYVARGVMVNGAADKCGMWPEHHNHGGLSCVCVECDPEDERHSDYNSYDSGDIYNLAPNGGDTGRDSYGTAMHYTPPRENTT